MKSTSMRFAGPALAGLLYFGAALTAQAQNSVLLENLVIPGDDATVLSLGRVEVTDTNLTRDEVARLFAKEADEKEVAGLLARMTAARVVIDKAVLTGKRIRMSFEPTQFEGVREGRFARMNLAGFSGEGRDEKGGTSSFVSRALEVTNGDFAAALESVRQGKDETGLSEVEAIRWEGMDVTFRQGDLPAADRGNEGSASIGAVRIAMDPKCEARCAASGSASGIVLVLPPASEAARQLKQYGFERLEFNVQGRSRYDGGTRKLTLEENRVSETQAGDLQITGVLENVDRDAIRPVGSERRMAALAGASIAELNVSFANRKLMDAIFAYGAASQKTSPEALKAKAAAGAAQLLPLFLGGDPSSLELAQSVQSFIMDPRNFKLSLKARGAPVPVARLSAIRDPASFLALVELRLEVNN